MTFVKLFASNSIHDSAHFASTIRRKFTIPIPICNTIHDHDPMWSTIYGSRFTITIVGPAIHNPDRSETVINNPALGPGLLRHPLGRHRASPWSRLSPHCLPWRQCQISGLGPGLGPRRSPWASPTPCTPLPGETLASLTPDPAEAWVGGFAPDTPSRSWIPELLETLSQEQRNPA